MRVDDDSGEAVTGGEMLLRAGDFDGAIANCHEANLKGPHFADPLAKWTMAHGG